MNRRIDCSETRLMSAIRQVRPRHWVRMRRRESCLDSGPTLTGPVRYRPLDVAGTVAYRIGQVSPGVSGYVQLLVGSNSCKCIVNLCFLLQWVVPCLQKQAFPEKSTLVIRQATQLRVLCRSQDGMGIVHVPESDCILRWWGTRRAEAWSCRQPVRYSITRWMNTM